VITITPETDYRAAMDSVNLLNGGKPAEMTLVDWKETVARNQAHLKLQIARAGYYKGFDLKPLETAAYASGL
jgi:hypothetical protein